ncbi:MAG: prolipoprotein diacylglyceryl transferase [Acidobacteria bacterium]|nr:prolipoprotein diacylglyceryl transferase [Acidobacteriota bacterium]
MTATFPTSLHVGPFTLYLYGVGLGVTAYVTYGYVTRRLRRRGIDVVPWPRIAIYSLLVGLMGARLAHVATNWSYYRDTPTELIAVWHGGLSSFGALAGAVPIALTLSRRWWPTVRLLDLLDAVVPALVAGWALGRVLGPQFMVAGGGHETNQWFGLYYEGQLGKRVPVPLIQGAEDALLWITLLWGEKRWSRGITTAVAMVVWGAVRAIDERLLLQQSGHVGSLAVQLTGVGLAVAGATLLLLLRTRRIKSEKLTL